MTQKLRYFCTLLLMAVVGVAWADEVVYKTALFGSDYNSQKVSSYTATWTATNDGFVVTLANFNNNNNGWDYVKCGRKNNASVATITTGAVEEAITKVDVTIDAITASSVNSIKLYTSSDNSNWSEAGSYTKASGVQTVSLSSPAADLYYKIEFDCASASSNGLVTVSKVEYYYDDTPASGDTPSISAQNVDIAYDATDGEIVYTINNPVEGGSLTASCEEDWIFVEDAAKTDAEGTISFICDANTVNTDRTATVTLTYTYDNETVTKNVTVTQAGYVAPFTPVTYSLATSITSGKHYIIVSSKEDGDAKAMGAQNNNNRAAADVTISNGTATVSNADVREFVISGPDAEGFYTIYDEDANGYLYAASSSSNYLKTQTTNDANGTWSIEIDGETNVATIKAQGSNTRNWMRYNNNNTIFSCYGSGQQDIYLYERDDESSQTVTIPIKENFTATTFSCDKALDFTGQNIAAFIITDEKGTTTQVWKVPANTGLYIEGAAGDYQIPVIASAAAITGNKLVATEQTTGQVLTFTPDASKVYYVFGKQNGKEAFFKVPAAGYTLPDGNKAVLEVDASAGAKEMIVIGGEATGIDSIDNGQLTTDNYYTVDGKLVKGQPTQKGLYIVNGRKVVVK